MRRDLCQPAPLFANSTFYILVHCRRGRDRFFPLSPMHPFLFANYSGFRVSLQLKLFWSAREGFEFVSFVKIGISILNFILIQPAMKVKHVAYHFRVCYSLQNILIIEFCKLSPLVIYRFGGQKNMPIKTFDSHRIQALKLKPESCMCWRLSYVRHFRTKP